MDFIGFGKEGDLDGRAIHCELYQPLGFCTEFDNVVYFVDYRSSCVKIASTMINSAKFLGSIGLLMNVFSIHEKKGIFSKLSEGRESSVKSWRETFWNFCQIFRTFFG